MSLATITVMVKSSTKEEEVHWDVPRWELACQLANVTVG